MTRCHPPGGSSSSSTSLDVLVEQALDPPGGRSTRGGLTLIEVLAALALASIVLPVGLLAVNHAVQAAGRTRDQAVLLRIAESRLAVLVATGDWQLGASSGACEAETDGDEPIGHRWRIAVDTWRDPAVHQLTLTIIAPDERELGLTTLVTVPP